MHISIWLAPPAFALSLSLLVKVGLDRGSRNVGERASKYRVTLSNHKLPTVANFDSMLLLVQTWFKRACLCQRQPGLMEHDYYRGEREK